VVRVWVVLVALPKPVSYYNLSVKVNNKVQQLTIKINLPLLRCGSMLFSVYITGGYVFNLYQGALAGH